MGSPFASQADDEADEPRQNPKGQSKQQVWPIVDIRGCNHQDMRGGKWRPLLAAVAASRFCDTPDELTYQWFHWLLAVVSILHSRISASPRRLASARLIATCSLRRRDGYDIATFI